MEDVCKENGEEEGSSKSLSQALVKRGYEKIGRVQASCSFGSSYGSRRRKIKDTDGDED
jgi:hypothetical protein